MGGLFELFRIWEIELKLDFKKRKWKVEFQIVKIMGGLFESFGI